MNIKDDLKVFLQEQLGKTASPIFLKRAFSVIEESADNKEGLSAASERVCKMISLFIDKGLAKKILENLNMKINAIR